MRLCSAANDGAYKLFKNLMSFSRNVKGKKIGKGFFSGQIVDLSGGKPTGTDLRQRSYPQKLFMALDRLLRFKISMQNEQLGGQWALGYSSRRKMNHTPSNRTSRHPKRPPTSSE